MGWSLWKKRDKDYDIDDDYDIEKMYDKWIKKKKNRNDDYVRTRVNFMLYSWHNFENWEDRAKENKSSIEYEKQDKKEGKKSQVADAKPWDILRVGNKVTHQSFGPGKIKSINKKYIVISFPYAVKKFLYPEAFEKGYLNC